MVLKPLNQHHWLENVNLALKAITQDGIKLVNIGSFFFRDLCVRSFHIFVDAHKYARTMCVTKVECRQEETRLRVSDRVCNIMYCFLVN